jgi:UDP-2-acetamido-2-deoxy-ribo-hexuluronate aminotransferase
VADTYSEELRDVVETPYVPEGYRSSWAQYSVLSDGRDTLRERLSSRGVPTGVYYGKPLHVQQALAALGYGEGDLPTAESVSRRVLSLPIHGDLGREDQARVTEAVLS